jgi:uncharacterized membrane protein YhaH (DUF805 family)
MADATQSSCRPLLWKLVAYGLATQLLALLVAAMTWRDGGRQGSGDGSDLGWWVALSLFAIGGLLLLVAVIVFGVRLGMRPPDEPTRKEVSEEERALLARRAR